MDLGAFLLTLFMSAIIKITVMAATTIVIYKNYRPLYKDPLKTTLPHLSNNNHRLLWWGLILFAISEIVCGIETYILFKATPFFRAIHGLASASSMAIFSYGIFTLVNERSLKFTLNQCTLLNICKGCPKIKENFCRFNPTLFILALFFLCSTIPFFFINLEIIYLEPTRYLLPFPSLNHWYDSTFIPMLKNIDPNYLPITKSFYLPLSTQYLEWRIFPLFSAILFAHSIVYINKRNELVALRSMMLGLGVIAYSYFELITIKATGDLVAGAICHEIAELLFLVFLTQFIKTYLHITYAEHAKN